MVKDNCYTPIASKSTTLEATPAASGSFKQPRAVSSNFGQFHAASSSSKQLRAVPSSFGQFQAVSSSSKQFRAVSSSFGQFQAVSSSPKQLRAVPSSLGSALLSERVGCAQIGVRGIQCHA
eukprot:12784185-Alexandrium_andersonii.AAC.1